MIHINNNVHVCVCVGVNQAQWMDKFPKFRDFPQWWSFRLRRRLSGRGALWRRAIQNTSSSPNEEATRVEHPSNLSTHLSHRCQSHWFLLSPAMTVARTLVARGPAHPQSHSIQTSWLVHTYAGWKQLEVFVPIFLSANLNPKITKTCLYYRYIIMCIIWLCHQYWNNKLNEYYRFDRELSHTLDMSQPLASDRNTYF